MFNFVSVQQELPRVNHFYICICLNHCRVSILLWYARIPKYVTQFNGCVFLWNTAFVYAGFEESVVWLGNANADFFPSAKKAKQIACGCI